MNNLKHDLRQSIVCSVLFAVVFGLIVSCGGSNPIVGLEASITSLVRLVNHAGVSMVSIPQNLDSSQPLMATMFQTSSQSSQLQQSFQGTGPCLSGPLPTAGFIPLELLSENNIVGGNGGGLNCGGVFDHIGGGIDRISGGTLTNPGLPMFMDGTLTTLVVTGRTINGIQIRCSDLTTKVSVKDQDLVQPYFVPATNSVVLGIGTTQLTFVCNLNVPSGDQVHDLTAQWAKI